MILKEVRLSESLLILNFLKFYLFGITEPRNMKKSTLQVRLNRRVAFDRRIEVPSPSFFFFFNKNEGKKSFADWLIELANRGFGMSTDAFLKSVKKFLDKEVSIMPFNNRSRSPPYPSHLLCFISRC